MNTKIILSTLWIFLTVNYIFCDIFSLYYSESLKELLTGKVGEIEFTQQFLLIFAIVMEIPMFMIILSRILHQKLNKILNIIVGVLMLIVQSGSLVTEENLLHYIFYSVVEIIILLVIISVAFKWSAHKVE